jgi:secreted trypsin-like serine protease
MRNTARASVKLISIALTAQLAQDAQAIVTRDDRDDSAFLSLGQEYAATTVMFRQASSPEEPGDAGTLIGARWVLTAAHVAAGLGPGDLAEVSGHVHTIERVVTHPEWRSNADYRVDIALVQLQESVSDVVPATVYRWSDESDAVLTLAGRGGRGTGLTGPVDEDGKLRAATNKVELVEESVLRFRFDAPADPDATEFEGISGPGDSGGPAYLVRDAVLFVVGVSSAQSARPTGGLRGRYGVLEYYPRVSHFAEWIQSTTESEAE